MFRPNWKKGRAFDRLLKKRGNRCFYCGGVMSESTMTIEHLKPKAKGGTDKISNVYLAHESCNRAAGHKSVDEKLKLRAQMRYGD